MAMLYVFMCVFGGCMSRKREPIRLTWKNKLVTEVVKAVLVSDENGKFNAEQKEAVKSLLKKQVKITIEVLA